MHSLSTIQKLNAEATSKAIQRARALGNHVVVHWVGATILTYEVHRLRPDVVAKHGDADRVETLGPLSTPESALVLGRDQSEDYLSGGSRA